MPMNLIFVWQCKHLVFYIPILKGITTNLKKALLTSIEYFRAADEHTVPLLWCTFEFSSYFLRRLWTGNFDNNYFRWPTEIRSGENQEPERSELVIMTGITILRDSLLVARPVGVRPSGPPYHSNNKTRSLRSTFHWNGSMPDVVVVVVIGDRKF